MLVLAVLCGAALASVAISLIVLLRVKTLITGARNDAAAARRDADTAMEAIRERIEGLCSQVNDLRREPVGSTLIRPGLNLSKRSQALRMHRRGDPPEQIAAALEIPLQELDLLVKVHRIVMNSF